MPTYAWVERFMRDLHKLSEKQQINFRACVGELVDDLAAGRRPRPSLRVKRVQGVTGVWEMTWDPDGRATFTYGPEQRRGEPHIIWRRIGTHDIFRQP